MRVREKDCYNIFKVFLISHFLIWVLIPSFSNTNLPLDVIEGIIWSDGWPLGWDKHPPLSSWFPGLFFQLFGSQDWTYYLLSQIFVVLTFFIVFKFAEEFFQNKTKSLISVLLLEGIYFYNFTTPEFNVNVCQLPFWALTVYYCWMGIKKNDSASWLLFGIFAALGILSKYLFIYILISIDCFLIYLIVKKKFKFKSLISLISFFIVLLPHLFWLSDNNYITFTYAFQRTAIDESNHLNHIIYPFLFLLKQLGILMPFLIMFLFTISKFKIKFNLKDKKLIFLLIINIVPIILMFFTSLITGAKIRTMWMTPFYLFSGVLFVYIFQSVMLLKKLKNFFFIFSILFILFPTAYFYISITQKDKRTDYPGKEISKIVQEKWNNNFKNKIGLIGGDEWYGGNLVYHLKPKPKWDNIFSGKNNISKKNNEDGFILIGDQDILSKICTGVFIKIYAQGVCMIGERK